MPDFAAAAPLTSAATASDFRRVEIPLPSLELLTTLHVTVDRPIDVGMGTKGERRLIPITGGTVEGPGLNGRVLPGGADVQLIRADGVLELEATYVIETTAGERVLVHNAGIRTGTPEAMDALRRGERVDPALIYFRSVPRFDTSAPALAMLTRSVFIGTGIRRPDGVDLQFFRVT
jgi:hypothetical protein